MPRLPRVSIYDYWPAIAATRHAAGEHPRVVEVGVHRGDDTARLRRTSPTGALQWTGFEPDPRNVASLREHGITVIEKAVSDTDGEAEFWLSSGWSPGCEGSRWHTDSSSLNAPTRHLEAHPWCRFDDKVTVTTTRLDAEAPTGPIDLLWVDVQGAQRKALAGAPETLQRTRYLYIECHPAPMYDGEPSFGELRGLLPGFVVVKRWESDVLFRNTALTSRLSWPFGWVLARATAESLARPAAAVLRRIRRRVSR